jgi:septum formation protein
VIELDGPVVLASASPTRRRLLGRVVAGFDVVAPRVDESRFRQPEPRARALALAEAKARDVAAGRPDAWVIAADTLVVCQGDVIGNPRSPAEAESILDRLARSPHEVLTAVCVVAPDERARSVCARATVRLRPLAPDEVRELAARPGSLERAGGYDVRPGDPNVERIEGDITTVRGLPLGELAQVLQEMRRGGGCGR